MPAFILAGCIRLAFALEGGRYALEENQSLHCSRLRMAQYCQSVQPWRYSRCTYWFNSGRFVDFMLTPSHSTGLFRPARMARCPTSSISRKGPEKEAKPEKVGPPPAWQARRKSPMIPPEGRGSVLGGSVNSLRRDSGRRTGAPPCEPQRDHPLLAHEQVARAAAALGQLFVQLLELGKRRREVRTGLGRFAVLSLVAPVGVRLVAFVPEDGDRRQFAPLREVVADRAPPREAVFADIAHVEQLDALRIAQLQGKAHGVHRVRAPAAQRTGAEVAPAVPRPIDAN